MKRKIVERKEKKSRKGLYWAIFIIIIMSGSIFGMWRGGDEETVKYGDYKYSKTMNGWKVYKGDLQIDLKYNPTELGDVEGINLDLNKYSKIYIVDAVPEIASIAYEFINVFGSLIKKPVTACSEDREGCENLPLKTCEDTSFTVGVVIFEIDEEESNVVYENNCLIIKGGDTEKLIKMLDKSALISYGLI